MPRVPRNRRASGSLEPGQVYHVTNRGVNRCSIFLSDLDRIIFLSLLAEACSVNGAICHAFCLMTTHFHLVIEDTRGMLSQLMHHLEFCYARYFNDTRDRSGPLFEGRFWAELIDSTPYFNDAVAYALLNPVRTQTPIVPSAEVYSWSSAALVCSDTTPAAFATNLINAVGGIEAVLGALPPSRLKTSRERRRYRLEVLASGAWLDRDHVLAGRAPEQYRQILAARATREPAPTLDPAPGDAAVDERLRLGTPQLASRPRFAGFDLNEVLDIVEQECRALIPASWASVAVKRVDLVAYSLWRFTSACAAEIASVARIQASRFAAVLTQLRRERLRDPAWRRLLWAVEWALRWRLRAAPHRP
jgi:REP element-mobilizing transposase RayT